MKAYEALLNGNEIRCSRCFGKPGPIRSYGAEERGFWFTAPCRDCGALVRWVRRRDGALCAGKEQEPEREGGFAVVFVDGEAVLRLP